MKLSITSLFLGLSFLCFGTSQFANAQEITGLSDWNVYLDPGHSGRENMGIYNYSEAEKVLAVALYLKSMLETRTDIDTVYISRTSQDQQVSLTQRTDHANRTGADFFHSIHSDAGPPSAESVLYLWGGWYQNGNTNNPIVEKTPNGGKKMGELMDHYHTIALRLPSRGDWPDRAFYGQSLGNTWPYLHVNRESDMASVLSESGFHTNPAQNTRNMNPEYKKFEAESFFHTYMAFHGLELPPVGILTGIVYDIDSRKPINGAEIRVGESVYTTDTYQTRFSLYGRNTELSNGFYYLENLDPGSEQEVIISAPGYYSDTLTVQLQDTTFTFADAYLVSSTPPFVSTVTPAEGDSSILPNAQIRIGFSRKMNRSATEAAIQFDPELTSSSMIWLDDDNTLLITPERLAFETLYTLTVGESASDTYGHLFDGDEDGEQGGVFSTTFSTVPTDTIPPQVKSISIPTNGEFPIHGIVTVEFDEIITQGLSSALFTFEKVSDGSPVPVDIRKINMDDQTLMVFYPKQPLDAFEDYIFEIGTGYGDLYDNIVSTIRSFPFKTNGYEVTPSNIDNFDSGIDNWWAPQQSGSTTGIISLETSHVAETELVNLTTGSSSALRVNYSWDLNADEHLIRQYLGGGSPGNVRFTSANVLQTFVFGDGSGNQFRFTIRDGNSQLEASPWYTVNWKGWKLIEWDMGEGEVIPWVNGNGTVNGQAKFDSFQLTYNPNATSTSGYMIFDDLRKGSKRYVTSNENLSNGIPLQFDLKQNYPNPFNPTTTIAYQLPEASDVRLDIFDMLGRRVASLVNTRISAGNHQVVVDASQWASGMYIYRLTAGSQVFTKKMTLIK